MVQKSRDVMTSEEGGKIHHSEKDGERNLFTPDDQYPMKDPLEMSRKMTTQNITRWNELLDYQPECG